MTLVAFHTGLEDPIAYACRLLRKAVKQGARALVLADESTIDILDKALWTFDAQDFVPHLRWRTGQVAGTHLARTPLWLATGDVDSFVPPVSAQVLVCIGVLAPPDLGAFERLIELVGLDESERRQARLRWREYEARGLTVQHHPAAAR